MQGGTVLFVDSTNASGAEIDALSDRGLKVVHVARPEDGFEWLTRDRPDVVITDLVFADSVIAAPDFIREVRAQVDAATSIIVLSRYLRASDRESARAAGADLFVMKPALPSALVFDVHRALILRRGGRRLAWNWPRRITSVASFPVVERRRTASC